MKNKINKKIIELQNVHVNLKNNIDQKNLFNKDAKINRNNNEKTRKY